ncbi:hypothetical protein JCM5350_002650 [Sporobolomyces pararoseus]
MELALWLLISTLFIQLIEYIGSDALASFIYTPFAPSSKSTKAKKAEILQLRADLAATSSQDEFSKWARIRRKLDKAVQELESTNSIGTAHKTRFQTSFKSILWLLTTIIPFIISSYHRKTPVIWLPKGWFGPLGWWLSLPSAPAGAVAVGIWTMACKRTLGSIKSAIYEFVPTPEEKTAQQFAKAQTTQEKVPVGVKASGGEEKVKKELSPPPLLPPSTTTTTVTHQSHILDTGLAMDNSLCSSSFNIVTESLTNPPTPPNSTSIHPLTAHQYYDQRQCGIEPGSPLFGATQVNHSRLDPLPPLPTLPYQQAQTHFKGESNPSVSGYGELSIVVSDIFVEPLSPSLPLSIDNPLPRSTPSLSPEVISIDNNCHLPVEPVEEKTDSLFELDFNLFETNSSSHFQHFPVSPTYPSFPSSSTQDRPLHPSTSFEHVQTTALSFDQGLQSPLGDSPLNPFLYSPEFSLSPQSLPIGEEFWSPQTHTGGGGVQQVWSNNVSPLLLDNLGLNPRHPNHDELPLFEEEQEIAEDQGLASSSSSRRSRVEFSPIMSQRTFENLLIQDLPPLPVTTCSLPPLPVVNHEEEEEQDQPMTEPVEGGEEEEVDEEIDRDLHGKKDSEWVPPPVATLSRYSPPRRRSDRPDRLPSSKRPSLASTRSTNRRHPSSSLSTPTTFPPSAPTAIQPRTHHYPSSTPLFEPLPQSLHTSTNHLKPFSRRQVSEPKPELELEPEFEDESTRRRRLNTLNARESRRRKRELEELRGRENLELKREREWLRNRLEDLRWENQGLRERLEMLELEEGEIGRKRFRRV